MTGIGLLAKRYLFSWPLRIQQEYSGYRNRRDLLDRIEYATSATLEIVPRSCKQQPITLDICERSTQVNASSKHTSYKAAIRLLGLRQTP